MILINPSRSWTDVRSSSSTNQVQNQYDCRHGRIYQGNVNPSIWRLLVVSLMLRTTIDGGPCARRQMLSSMLDFHPVKRLEKFVTELKQTVKKTFKDHLYRPIVGQTQWDCGVCTDLSLALTPCWDLCTSKEMGQKQLEHGTTAARHLERPLIAGGARLATKSVVCLRFYPVSEDEEMIAGKMAL